ncbi:MAG: type II toxin-antitoxin system death-on-curing family toxin [Paracoccaceae bacterium]
MNLPGVSTLRVFHDAQLRRFGGAPGLRDAGLLESAVGRVQSAMLYSPMDAVDSAAMLCHAILKNHAFVDGNKRTAYGAMVMTLAGNGLRVEASDDDLIEMILAAAAGHEPYQVMADWLRERVVAVM